MLNLPLVHHYYYYSYGYCQTPYYTVVPDLPASLIYMDLTVKILLQLSNRMWSDFEDIYTVHNCEKQQNVFSFVLNGVALKSTVSAPSRRESGAQWQPAYFLAADFLGRRTAWMLGRTPPWAMVTPARSLLSSSSFLTAS